MTSCFEISIMMHYTWEDLILTYDLLKSGVHLSYAHLTLPVLWAALMKAIYGMQVTAISSFTASSSAGRVLILFQRDMLLVNKVSPTPCCYELACLAEDWKDCSYRSQLSYSDLNKLTSLIYFQSVLLMNDWPVVLFFYIATLKLVALLEFRQPKKDFVHAAVIASLTSVKFLL